MRQFQLHLTFEQDLAFGGKTTQWMELNEHKLKIPGVIFNELRFKLPLQAIDEIETPIDSLY